MNKLQQPLMSSAGLLILRLGVGGFLVCHGWTKVQWLVAGNFALGDPIGLGSELTLVLATFAEFVCALLVVIGLATRLAAIPVVVNMSVAAFVALASAPWTMDQAAKLFMAGKTIFPLAKEMPLLFLIPFLALIFLGPGLFSLDALIRRRILHRHPATIVSKQHIA